MNIKQLEKATKLIEQIKEHDENIMRLEKMAIELSNGASANISMSVELKKEDIKKPVLDSDGSLCSDDDSETDFDKYMNARLPQSILGSFAYGGTTSSKPSNKILYEDTLSDSDSLMVINVIVFRKKQQRQRLINQVEKMKFA